MRRCTLSVRRLYPRQIRDKFRLSALLEQLLSTLQNCPLQVTLRALSYDCHIPECIFTRLLQLRQAPEDACNLEADDFHIVFSNVLFRYPTVKIFEQSTGEVFIVL